MPFRKGTPELTSLITSRGNVRPCYSESYLDAFERVVNRPYFCPGLRLHDLAEFRIYVINSTYEDSGITPGRAFSRILDGKGRLSIIKCNPFLHLLSDLILGDALALPALLAEHRQNDRQLAESSCRKKSFSPAISLFPQSISADLEFDDHFSFHRLA